jgi:hypothetical protein
MHKTMKGDKVVDQPESLPQRALASLKAGLRALHRQIGLRSLLIYLLWAIGLGLVLASYLDWQGAHHTGFIPVDVRPRSSADYSASYEHGRVELKGGNSIRKSLRSQEQ